MRRPVAWTSAPTFRQPGLSCAGACGAGCGGQRASAGRNRSCPPRPGAAPAVAAAEPAPHPPHRCTAQTHQRATGRPSPATVSPGPGSSTPASRSRPPPTGRYGPLRTLRHPQTVSPLRARSRSAEGRCVVLGRLISPVCVVFDTWRCQKRHTQDDGRHERICSPSAPAGASRVVRAQREPGATGGTTR